MITIIKNINFALIFFSLTICVSGWKKCDQTFCGRIRRSPEGYRRYALDIPNVVIHPNLVQGTLITDVPSKNLKFSLNAHSKTVFSIIISKISTTRREKVPIMEPLESFPLKLQEKTSNSVTIAVANMKAIIYGKPLKVEIYSYNKLMSILNPQDRLSFELDGNNTAIAMDVSFIDAQRAYGIPLHAEHLSLRTTGPGGLDPYRLYNVNYENYNIISTEALHASIPLLYGHGTKQSSAIHWHNFAQTWVDITVAPNQVDAFFMSETGLRGDLTMLIMTGPTLAKTVQQNPYGSLYGSTPPYFTLGYHQSRQSYMTQNEVLKVVEKFDENHLPLDVIHLDIDYAENKKSFTWDPERFAKPLELQTQLEASNRKLVVAIDPQFKAERGYFVHDNFTANGYYMRNPGGSDYLGLCRSGLSGYFDVLNLDATFYYTSLFSIESFKGKNIHVWNNMNEPVVFQNEEHENTLPGDLEHYDDVSKPGNHRETHNLYGSNLAFVTNRALSERPGYLRPFVLTRSHSVLRSFIATWTGNNYASWENLAISFPMCLTEALVGVNFCGATVGGFHGIPDDELYQRWYQAAAWLPLYRADSSNEVPRREPYLYSDRIKSRVRTALNQRYAHIPVWYTLASENTLTGAPIIRPITYHYPNEDDALSIDNEILVGANILAAPVLKQGAFIVPVYLPGGESEIWYNIDDNYKVLAGTGYHLLQVNLDSVPVFYRGGSIISRKNIARPSTGATYKDPYTLYICLDKRNQAEGTLYVDDYESFSFMDEEYLYLGFSFANNTFKSYKIDPLADYDGAAPIGEMIILNPPKNIINANVITDDNGINDNNYKNLKLTYSEDESTLTINNMLLNLKDPLQIELST